MRAELQLEVEPDDLLRFHLDRLGRRRLEARQLRLHDVGADGQRRDGVVAGVVGDRRCSRRSWPGWWR